MLDPDSYRLFAMLKLITIKYLIVYNSYNSIERNTVLHDDMHLYVQLIHTSYAMLSSGIPWNTSP